MTGTVFSVKHGTRGSRVAVFEGEVRVKQGEDETVLQPGDQLATDPDLGEIALSEEIGWSRFSAEHMALLAEELTALGEEIDALPRPEPRFSSELLDTLPADTAFFISVPNLSQTLGQANDLLQERIDQNEILRQWWDARVARSEAEHSIEAIIERVARLGEHLGEEIVVAMAIDADGEPSEPFVSGIVNDTAAFRAQLEREVSELSAELGEEIPMRLVEDHAALQNHVDRELARDTLAPGAMPSTLRTAIRPWIEIRPWRKPTPKPMRYFTSGSIEDASRWRRGPARSPERSIRTRAGSRVATSTRASPRPMSTESTGSSRSTWAS